MNKELPTIEIKGYCGSGKTSLAHLIEIALFQHGINAEIVEYANNRPTDNQLTDADFVVSDWPKSLEGMKNKTIKINTHQINRNYIHQLPLDEIEFKETPTNIVKEAIDEYNNTNHELPDLPDNFMGFKP